MNSELLRLPSDKEHNSYINNLSGHIKKIVVSGGVGIIAAGTSTIFPPAIGGVGVSVVEALRQFALFHKEYYQFHKKYPDLDKND